MGTGSLTVLTPNLAAGQEGCNLQVGCPYQGGKLIMRALLSFEGIKPLHFASET